MEKSFVIKVNVDSETTYEEIEQLLDNSNLVNDVDLLEVYED